MTHRQQQHPQEEEYDENTNNIQRSLDPLDGMGCFHLLFHGIMICVKELNTVCRNVIERRCHSIYDNNNNNNNEENVSLLTEIMEEDVDYDTRIDITPPSPPIQKDTDSTIRINALDKAMKNFVETNDPQALLHVFDVALKDDKQD